ncbi:hypothetical protein [Xanthomonas sp. NCPPB 2632]|uniref:hypothetical protein n=1 Tax=Xanthomonas sp. NCPPB 2632 TaxID=3240912 RepID=UPI003517418B
MKTLVATLALVVYTAPALLGASCRAQDTQPASYKSPEAAVKALYGAKLLQKWEARGDLNGDGREDWAAEISYQDGDLNSRRLMILVKNEQGAYVVAALSKPDTLPRTFIEEMEIRGLTLHVRESFPGDHPQASEAKVREYRGIWSVVGKTVTTYYSESDKATTEDTNLLNGARITTYLEGEKVVRTVKSKQPVDSTNLIDNTI